MNAPNIPFAPYLANIELTEKPNIKDLKKKKKDE